MKKILFLVNHDITIYNYRREIVERFIAEGYEVHVSSPYGERIDELVKLGIIFHKTDMERHGTNPLKEWKVICEYKKLMKQIKPDYCLGFTIKPNIYGAIAARKNKIPFVANITGLGMATENPGIARTFSVLLYKHAFKNVQRVFFQNAENQGFFDKYKIASGKGMLIPGSGVNLIRFPYQEYPADNVIRFAFISRIMAEKGIEEYLNVAEAIGLQRKDVEFHVCGFCEQEYHGRLYEMAEKGIVKYHGLIRNVAEFMANVNCVVHPTYYPEGMSSVLLEACATGRPIISTDRSGCREIVQDGYNGYLIPQKDEEALKNAIERFLKLSWEEKVEMGRNARAKVEKEFDREIVVQRYVEEVNR